MFPERRVRWVIRIAEFIMQNSRTIGIVYLIVAAVVFVAVAAFFIWIERAEDAERELYPDDVYYYPDGPTDTATTALFIFMTAAGCAILWFAIPLLIVGVWVYGEITEKFPSLMGDMAEDAGGFDEEKTEVDK